MNQIVKDKMQREIMVIANRFLFENIMRESRFYDQNEANFENIILGHYEYMIRWQAETNFDYKQPIPYGVVINDRNEIFVYKRWWSNSNAWEQRLHEKISIWVGWHIEREDEWLENPIKESLLREIEEEINVKSESILAVDAIWYLNNESDEVSQVHLWIAYLIQIKSSDFDLLDGEIDGGEFVSLPQLQDMLHSGNYDIESWSQILIPEIINRLK